MIDNHCYKTNNNSIKIGTELLDSDDILNINRNEISLKKGRVVELK